LLTNRKKSLMRSKQTPDPSVQFLVNMQTTDKFNAEYQHNYFLLRFMIKLLWNWAILINAFASIFFDWSTESGSTIIPYSKQTPDPSVQFLVNMQTTDKFNADEQLRIGWPYANTNWFQIRYDNYMSI
jgi:hypothetical protein